VSGRESGPVSRSPVRGTSIWQQPDRRVVMVVSAGEEMSLADVVTNLATVCAEVGQRVALLSTAGLASPTLGSELTSPTMLSWKDWPTPGNGSRLPIEQERARLQSGSVSPADVGDLLGETGVPGVSRLDLRYFVGHPAQVVIRVPEVIAALRQIVDVVFLEVPSYLALHHGEALTPLADVVLVVAERETTTLDDMRQVRAALRHLDAPVVGLALTEGAVELYEWGLAEAEIDSADDQAMDEREPTEQIPISRPGSVTPKPADEVQVAEPEPREA
jgi:hypothetical protein